MRQESTKGVALLNRKKIVRYFEHLIYKDTKNAVNQSDIEFLRNRIFQLLSFVLIFLVGPVMIFGAYLFLDSGHFAFAILEILIYFLLLIILKTGLFSMESRKIWIILIVYFLSIFILIVTGSEGAGSGSIFFTTILAVSLLNARQSLKFLVINFLTFITISLLLYHGFLPEKGLSEAVKAWPMQAVSIQICMITLFYLWNVIYRGLDNQIKRFEQISRGVKDGIWDWDLVNDYFYLSPVWYENLGYSVRDIPNKFKSVLALVHKDDKKKFLSAIREFSTADSYLLNLEVRFRHKDSSDRWMWTRGIASRDVKGKVLRIAGSCTDITERKNKEAEVAYLNSHDSLTGLFNRSANLTKYIADTIGNCGINADRLKVEITESTLMKDIDTIKQSFHDLKALGVKLALDDFGTGYSSFSYL